MNQVIKFIRNPLGIIALFVCFCEGFIVYAFGKALTEHLNVCDLRLIIIFMMVFPLFVFIMFCYMTIEHTIKLYSPKDFRDESNWFSLLSNKNAESDRLLTREGKIISVNINNTSTDNNADGSSDYHYISNRIEDMVNENLSQRYNVHFLNNVVFVNYEGDKLSLDGFAHYKDCSFFVETKRIHDNVNTPQLISNLKRFLRLSKQIGQRYSLSYRIIALVCDDSDTMKIESLTSMIRKFDDEVIILFFEYRRLMNHE